MAKIVIENMQNCAGCYLCVLACSFFTRQERSFNLSEAKINVSRIDGQNRFRVSIDQNCSACGQCANFCHYGVLSKM
ncbi:4Fe-4S dicluster domain-containing protein [Calderihabitans maritimus]|uniref:4Fe-4S ferredoxin n=1 Tax=Calderihabitans maritimus TaxID=1246530 RepID=A0A1Z5HQ24_9FIRM|nr:4Fe-4S dicluster domain-containing protein [Calderihabitans maritimus]GAW91467.1 4Fe-4S ferredoxin [Calderihabitans maritimus]